jgi:uncharacterized protein YjbI with pentapeptide repeats
MRIRSQLNPLYSSILLAALFAVVALEEISAAPINATASAQTQADPMSVCSVSGEASEPQDSLPADINAQLSNPANRINKQDWSGQDLSGKSFKGKVLVHVMFKKARLQGADLSDAIICGSDLGGADLTGARLDRTLIGGFSRLDGANLTNVSAHRLVVADASYEDLRIDGTDLSDAHLICEGDLSRCLTERGSFATMIGADLRGATVEHLSDAVPGLGSARLAGLRTQLEATSQANYPELAKGVGPDGHMTFFPGYGYAGSPAEFTAEELANIPAMIAQMQAASVHSSFACSKATSSVEKAICSDPKLAALDAAMGWLWGKLEHTPALNAAQKKWLAERATCVPANLNATDHFDEFLRPEPFASPANPDGCIGMSYVKRIKELATQSSLAEVPSATYTTDPPLELPQGKAAALAQKFLTARGYREDEIVIENWGRGAGKIGGQGTWANGHMCGFESSEPDTKRVGSRVQVFEEGAGQDDRYSTSFVVTPQVVIWVGGDNQFQCGARGGWSNAYFRQPNELFSAKLNRKAN